MFLRTFLITHLWVTSCMSELAYRVAARNGTAAVNLTTDRGLRDVRIIKAKFHYTDPTGPARTQRSFAAKKSVRVRVGPVGSVSVSV